MKFICGEDYIKDPALFTPFTFVHFYCGLVYYITIKNIYPKMSFNKIFWIFLILHTIYEVKDLLCYNDWICINIFQSCSDLDNSYNNSVGDTIAALFGVVVAPEIFKRDNVFAANALSSLFVLWFIFTFFNIG
jgi:hypothetical protein